MLGLLAPTDPSWVEAAETDLDGLLSDHAHCELKAAQTALSMIGRFGEEAPLLVEPLAALAREEIAHFGQVHAKIADRRQRLGAPRADDYVGQLQSAARAARPADQPAILDRLLVAALIEGRSCERFRLLSERLKDASLRAFYRELMASEAKHFALFSSLAGECCGARQSKQRLSVLAEREAAIANRLALGPTVHG